MFLTNIFQNGAGQILLRVVLMVNMELKIKMDIFIRMVLPLLVFHFYMSLFEFY